jgi:hypothetical protein
MPESSTRMLAAPVDGEDDLLIQHPLFPVLPVTGCACGALTAIADTQTCAPAGGDSPVSVLAGARPGRETNPTRLKILRAMSEAEWMIKVRETATTYGWISYHTRDSRGSDHGWPDLTIGHAGQRRTLFIELKKETGKVTPAQHQWLTHLESCGFEVAVWRPRDEAEVLAVLGPRKLRATRSEGGTS